jgi:hypothetical protein
MIPPELASFLIILLGMSVMARQGLEASTALILAHFHPYVKTTEPSEYSPIAVEIISYVSPAEYRHQK